MKLNGIEIPNIEIYTDQKGKQPVVEFLKSLSDKERVRIVKTVSNLSNGLIPQGMPYTRFLREGIYEFRQKVHTGQVRILYFFVVEGKMVFTHGFMKKTQKTPKAEIDRAIRIREEWRKQHDIR